MKIYNTPAGTRDLLYGDCVLRREAQARLSRCFAARGYHEIATPVLEYYDLLTRSGDPVTQEELYLLQERSGRLLVLRPDMTTPIARVAATKLAPSGKPEGGGVPEVGDAPLRFYYLQPVFRAGGQNGRAAQVEQAGIELLGAVGLRSDSEVIALAAESLACTAGSYRIEIGHAGFFRKLAASLGTGADFNEELRSLVNRKNFAALGDLLAEYRESPAGRALCRLPQLFGGEEVLDEALELARGCAGTDDIEYLREIFRELQSAGFGSNITLDLGLVHRLDYYTGVVFRGYIAGAGSPVLSGGRYDSLTGYLGRPLPATGFAADVDALCAVMPPPEKTPLRYLLHTRRGALRRAMDYMDSRPGLCALSPHEELPASRALALKLGAELVCIE